MDVRWNIRVILISTSMMAKDVEHFFKCFLAIEIPLLRILFRFVLSFLKVSLGLLSSSDILDISTVGCGVGEDLFPFCRLSFCPFDDVLFLTEAFQFPEVPFITC